MRLWTMCCVLAESVHRYTQIVQYVLPVVLRLMENGNKSLLRLWSKRNYHPQQRAISYPFEGYSLSWSVVLNMQTPLYTNFSYIFHLPLSLSHSLPPFIFSRYHSITSHLLALYAHRPWHHFNTTIMSLQWHFVCVQHSMCSTPN